MNYYNIVHYVTFPVNLLKSIITKITYLWAYSCKCDNKFSHESLPQQY